MRFYVYVLRRPYGEESPCYVGKGQGNRVDVHEYLGSSHYNRHLANVIAKAGGTLLSEIVFRTDDENAAFAEERRLIALYGRKSLKTGTLCNLTDGGDGHSGYVQSPELRTWRSVDMQGNKRGVGNTNRRGAKHSEETLAKLRGNTNCLGKRNAAGYKHTDEWKTANSARMRGNEHTKGRKRTQVEKEAISSSMKGNRHSAGHKQTPEHIAARAASAAVTRAAKINPLALEAWRKSMGIQNG